MLDGYATGRLASAAALILVVGLVGALAVVGAPGDAPPQVWGTPTFTPTITPTPTATATPTPSPSPTPTWTPSPSPTPTATATPTPTATPSPSPTPTATSTPASASDHLWLLPPIGPDAEGDRYPGTYFPYGSTGGGRYHLHHGVDFMNPAGTRVLAAAEGTVLVAGNDLETVYGKKPDFYGNLVVQELDRQFNGQPVYLLYGHLSRVLVSAGEHLEAGDTLGLVGMTGVAIGNHLHLEVRLGRNHYDSTRNPVLWMRPEPGQGAIAGLLVDAEGQPIPETPVTFFRAAEAKTWWRQVQTYADREVNPDDELGENFALGYVPAGEYLVKAKIGEKSYVRPVTVEPGQIVFVTIVAGE